MTEIFNLLMVCFNQHFFYVRIKQVKAEVQKHPFKCAPREKNKKVGKILQKQLRKSSFLSKVVGCWPANLRKVNSSLDILQ